MLCPVPRTPLQHCSLVRRTIGHSSRTYANKKYFKIPNLNVCRVSIYPTHQLSHSAENILKDPSHVLHPALGQRYQSLIRGRNDDFQKGLWIMFTSNPMHRKKVVRSWARRRIAQAVTQELRVRGFDGKGRRVDTGSTTEKRLEESGERRPDALVGTVDIEVMNQSVETGFAEVQRQVGLLAEQIVRICGRQVRQTNPRRGLIHRLIPARGYGVMLPDDPANRTG